jgi:hypothetical protein
MKKIVILSLALLFLGFAATANAVTIDACHPICILVGDVDNYGNIPGASDQGTVIWPGPVYDGRSAAEQAATNGAQLTDSYSTLFPGFSPADIVSEKGSVIIPIPAGMVLHDATFVMAMGDFQAPSPGIPIAMNFNGVALDASQPQPNTFSDGFQVSAIRSFVLTPGQLTAANAAGQFICNFDHTGSNDLIAFDWFKLCANVCPAPIPGSLMLLGSGILGLVGVGIRRKSS